ncbi:virulence factor SrfB [Rhizobium sp. C4]|uniref:virulence factor SrfB n=1 Tax=Rhizobium sp. C4 TaxID=1349800 RepID=UPI001E3871CB|nr:virulence factor SrfB [Rhizobium sp. C4]MCD2176110.1 virulence factor SrfB [Rhizobium sp. C4]
MLTNLANFSEGLSLVPDSGIQFVEFGFDFDSSPRLARSFIERSSPGQLDAEGRTLIRLLTNWNDNDPTATVPYSPHADDVSNYEINRSVALKTYMNRWVPVPFFKIEPGKDALGNELYAQGPTDWVRMRITETRNTYGDREASHRVIFAFDTSLAPIKPNRPYLAPTPEDAQRTERFRLMTRLPDIISFLSHKITMPGQGEADVQQWVDDWLRDALYTYRKEENKNRELRPEHFPHRFEHLALYITLVQFIGSVIKPGPVSLIDTLSEVKAAQAVDVDLVLDIGNSRSCGLLIQSFPDDMNVDLNNSLVMELRDLSKPELVHRDPFESQCELVAAEFGPDDIARRSGRARAFFWPSLLRIGPEASRLRGESEGTEATTGISSPKRYLWSSDPVLQDWKFRSSAGYSDTVPRIEMSMYRFVNDRGDVLEQIESDRQKFKLKVKESDTQTASRFSFSKSSFFTFMLVEIIAQAMSMMNNPGVRRERRLKDSPRRLRRIILTIPSATPVQEQRILRSRAEAAVKLLWSLSGWDEVKGGINSRRPEVHCSWDEASSVHLVYLYGEAVHKLGGSIRTLFHMLGKPRERHPALPADKGNLRRPESSLRIASVDVGGGTTDLMVTTYYQTDNVALYPDQNFREGFRIAGDDLLKSVIERLVTPRFEEMLTQSSMTNARNFLKDRFAGDNPTMSEQEKHLRRQFVLQVLLPVAIGILSECEAMPANSRQTSLRKISDFFPEDTDKDTKIRKEIPVDKRILGYLKEKAKTLGASEFLLADCEILIDPAAMEECVLATFDSVFDNIAEAINHLDADIVLLTGRPMRLPQLINLFVNKMAVRPDAVIPIRDYRVGTWYPFRGVSNTHIDDPKTTAVVGAMLCALSERQITNFTLYSQYLRMRSTARHIGLLESSTKLPDEKLLFSDIDLDSSGNEEDCQFNYHSPVRIGYRQLPLERWVATPLYKLSLSNTRAAAGIQRPINVTIARNTQKADKDETDEAVLLSTELTREEFIIEDAEDLVGVPVKRLMELKLDTLAIDTGDGYWLDTGILSIQ